MRCESPNCGAEIPLLKNLWLMKKRIGRSALRLEADPRSKVLLIDVIDPKHDSDVQPGTVTRSRARCLCCGSALAQDRIRAQLQNQSGGGDAKFDEQGRRVGGATLMAVLTSKGGVRRFRTTTSRDYAIAAKAAVRLAELMKSSAGSAVSPIPDEPLTRVPVSFGVINVWVYGVRSWGDLFSMRQKLVLSALVTKIRGLPRSSSLEEAVANLAGLAVSRFTDDYSNMMRWMDRGTPSATFARPALPMVWDYCGSAFR